jgi:hypothetical protein
MVGATMAWRGRAIVTDRQRTTEDPEEPQGRPNPDDDREGPKDEDEAVDEQSADSFPSSDPPAW